MTINKLKKQARGARTETVIRVRNALEAVGGSATRKKLLDLTGCGQDGISSALDFLCQLGLARQERVNNRIILYFLNSNSGGTKNAAS